MSHITFLFSLLVLLFASCVHSETIVADNLGNIVGLPLAGGNATAHITNFNSMTSTSPYYLNVYVNDGQTPGSSGANESFFVRPPTNNGLYGNATLFYMGYSSTFNVNNLVQGNYLGSLSNMNHDAGLYQFRFSIPVLGRVLVNISYYAANPNLPGGPVVNTIDEIVIQVDNPARVVGDPQFVGLRGQSYQVHGIDGAVYNIISDKNIQVNSRFVFLSEGECPIINGKRDTNCWSHSGSYLGEMSFQQRVDGQVHQAFVRAGDAKKGFGAIELDGKSLKVGDTYTFGTFGITVKTSHRVQIRTETFSFELSNSDMFINQAVKTLVPLSKLQSHGLLGQTHAARVYSTAVRYIEGVVDDYVITDNNIFGTEFVYNKFQL